MRPVVVFNHLTNFFPQPVPPARKLVHPCATSDTTGLRRSNHRTPSSPVRAKLRDTSACGGRASLMIFVVHGPEPTQTAFIARVLTLTALTWLLVGAPAGVATADACAYASTGPDGTQAVAVAGSLSWPTPPACPKPTPPPPPPSPPCPTPTPTPTPPPAPSPPPAPKPPPPRPKPTPKPVPPPPPHPAAPRPAAPPPPPPPAPVPPPAPKPSPKPTPHPSAAPVSYPRYRAPAPHTPRHDGPSPLTFVLLITAPAAIAVAALRPR